MTYFIEAKCLTAEHVEMFTGTDEAMRARLDELSGEGWEVAYAIPAEKG